MAHDDKCRDGSSHVLTDRPAFGSARGRENQRRYAPRPPRTVRRRARPWFQGFPPLEPASLPRRVPGQGVTSDYLQRSRQVAAGLHLKSRAGSERWEFKEVSIPRRLRRSVNRQATGSCVSLSGLGRAGAFTIPQLGLGLPLLGHGLHAGVNKIDVRLRR